MPDRSVSTHRDPVVSEAIAAEETRQEQSLNLIASENYASADVLAAQGSVLTNKYAVGFPGSRSYSGCEHMDTVERAAIERAKDLFGAEHVNVQPHSGTQANMAVYFSVLDPGDRILSLDLTEGGHFTHGHPANFSGRLYEVESYGVDPETGRIDYETLESVATSFDPDLLVSGSSGYPREFDFDRIGRIADRVDAYHLADIAHITGLVAAGVHTNPVESADFVTASTHKSIRAGRGGLILTDAEHADSVDEAVFPGSQGGPLMHNVAGKAVGFWEAQRPEFTAYAEQVVANAKQLATTLQRHGISVVTGGTDKHLVLVDLRDSHPDLTGERAQACLETVGITVNKHVVPGETRSRSVTSGIRVGTPALTTRGFTESGVRDVAECLATVLDSPDDDRVTTEVRDEVRALATAHPIYR